MSRRLTRRQLLAGAAGAAGVAVAAGCTSSEGPAAAGSPHPRPRAARAALTDVVEIDGVALPGAGWLREENSRPGSPHWPVLPHQVQGAIEGYAGQASAVAGDRVVLHVSTTSTRYHVEAYRMGWYGGIGGREVWRSPPLRGRVQAVPGPAPPTNMIECSWSPDLEVEITSEWPPGVYLLKLVGEGRAQQYVPLTVRDDSSTAAFCVMNSITTWAAYNLWGSYSLYLGADAGGQSFANRARVVSLDRPVPAHWGNGAADLIGLELPLVFLLERYGLDVTYWTDLDLHTRGHLLLGRGALISLGHDEYWSRQMYDTALSARDHGVNFAFFGANACFRHIRVEDGPGGPDRRVVCYKITDEDPLYGKDNADVTADWPSPPVPRPESILIGASYRSYPITGGLRVSDSWLFHGCGLPPGHEIPGIMGNEYDAYVPSEPGPRNLDVLAHSPVVCRGVPDHSDATWYTASGGGGVFASGTNDWIPALAMDTGIPMLEIIPGFRKGVTPAMIRATVNVLDAIGHGPGSHHRPSTGNWRRYYSAGASAAALPQD
jgi:hypothetical protein